MLKPITKNLYFCMDKNIRKQYYQIDKQYFSFHILYADTAVHSFPHMYHIHNLVLLQQQICPFPFSNILDILQPGSWKENEVAGSSYFHGSFTFISSPAGQSLTFT